VNAPNAIEPEEIVGDLLGLDLELELGLERSWGGDSRTAG
jgi:hypothetical protein